MKLILANTCFGRSRNCLYRSNNLFNLQLLAFDLLRLIVTGSLTLPVTSA